MEPSRKKGNFVGYSETSKSFKIYVPSERHIEVSHDVTFHEEFAFNKSKYIECDIEEHESAILEYINDDSSLFDV